MIRGNVILAIAKRNFVGYFSGALGYIFIVVFCVATAAFAFNTQFFTNNQANFDQLTAVFPWLLLFLVPAITMTAWADERKLGTDELLLTLPARESEIVIGKYLAVLGVYTAAILFSLVNVITLTALGEPDFGLIFSTFFGYWLSGAALLAAGMFASSLTSSPTVAFVLGVLLCGIPVIIDRVPEAFGFVLGADNLESVLNTFGTSTAGFQSAMGLLSLKRQLTDFSTGVVPLYNIVFFALFGVLMLYLNYSMLAQRRWGRASGSMFAHSAARFAFLGLTGIAALYLISRVTFLPIRADLTSERLFSLSDATLQTLRKIPDDQNITIQAFVSTEVPKDYSETRRQLIGLLREFDARTGNNVTVRIVDVVPFEASEEEATAAGVTVRQVGYEDDTGRLQQDDIYLGAVINSATDDIAIPFFDRGIPVEYELTRSLATVIRSERRRVGVLTTDAKVMGTTDFMSPSPKWAIIEELEKQYDVVRVDPNLPFTPKQESEAGSSDEADGEGAEEKPASGEIDVLLAVSPSSLTQPQMDNFLDYVRSGRPVIIFEDPLTISAPFQTGMGITQAPVLPKPSPQSNPMFGGRTPPPPDKATDGRLTELQRLLKISWPYNQVVYDRDNPHAVFSHLPDDVIFLSQKRAQAGLFNETSPITQPLQEIVAMFPGVIMPYRGDGKDDVKRVDLLRTGPNSGTLMVNSGRPEDAQPEQPLVAEMAMKSSVAAGQEFRITEAMEHYSFAGSKRITLGGNAEEFRRDSRLAFILATPDNVTRFSEKRLQRGTDVEWVSETSFRVTQALGPEDVLVVVQDTRLDTIAEVRPGNPFMGGPSSALAIRPDREVVRRDSSNAYIIAAHFTSEAADNPLNVVFVADIDLIGDQFFGLRRSGTLEVELDNVTFVLNAIDQLTGETEFIELRSRRASNRSLKYVERLTQKLRQDFADAEKAAEQAVTDKLEAAREKQKQEIARIENEPGDETTKSIKMEELRQQLQRKLDLQTEQLERRAREEKRAAAREMRRQISAIQNRQQVLAWILPAILPVCFGLLFLGMRSSAEKKSVNPNRRR